jgi:RND family efflux transporter MFP subunit
MAMKLKSLAVAATFTLTACSADGNGAGQASPPTALVKLRQATQGSIADTVTLYGVAEPGAAGRFALSAPTEAIIERIAAPPGSKVSRGQLIVQLSAAPNARLDLAKASTEARVADAAYARAVRLRADGLVGDTEVETARAAVQSAKATLKSFRSRVGSLALTAPAPGFVAGITGNPGDQVQAGMLVATISSAAGLRARFGADPMIARALSPGEPISIMNPGGKGSSTVRIQSIDPGVNPVTRLQSVFANLPATFGTGPGATLQGEVVTHTQNNTVTILYAALLDDGGQPYVFVVVGGVAHRHDVQTGAANRDRIAITKGVRAGDSVVIEGGTALEDGMKVRTR